MAPAVEDGGREDFIAQQLRPLRKGLMTDDDDTATLVSATDQVEEVVRLDPIEREIAHC
jgi:hypothetical protein